MYTSTNIQPDALLMVFSSIYIKAKAKLADVLRNAWNIYA